MAPALATFQMRLKPESQFNSIGKKMLSDTAVNFTAAHLGAFISIAECMERFFADKIDYWISEVDALLSIAIP